MITLCLGDKYNMGVFKPEVTNKTGSFSDGETLFVGHPSELPRLLEGHSDVDGLVVRIRHAGNLPWSSPGEILDGKLHIYEMREDFFYTGNEPPQEDADEIAGSSL